ncbi:hypothetical protein HB364_14035 [Pseudoflavitalea sp. X16]|uniref:hypothetical protein n=1 Tax=Paraflavitalea devenefica TaxID=2716334 RepID=UPI00141E59B5|nr:hypothetical protein [Paraflavitalea devenefica]NII26209.1 hypothetical protein [Paraflavitalea devenefica]
MKQMPAAGCGIILFPNEGQFLYLYLPEAESQQLKSVNGRCIATTLFMENCFWGFEEGVFSKGLVKIQLRVIPHTGYYAGSMLPGGYLSFLLTFLGHKQDKGQF